MIRHIVRKWVCTWTEPPFLPLCSSFLLISATSRFSFALTGIAALAWVFLLTPLVCVILRKVLPLFGRKLIIMLLAGFLASLFYIALSLIAPTLAVESSLSIMFIPPIYCLAGFNYDSMGAGIRAKNVQQKPDAPSVFSVLRPPLEFLASVSVMMVGLALIREPLGYATLSLPGGTDGIIELFNPNDDGHYTLHIISQSAGALLILGYLLALFRWLNHEQDTGIHPEKKHNPNSAPENAPPLAKPTAPLTPPIPPTKTVSASSTAQDSKTGGKK